MHNLRKSRDSNTILKDFKNQVVQLNHNKKNSDQYANNVRQVWTSIEPNHSNFPRNLLQDTDAIKDYFYQPLCFSKTEFDITKRATKSPCTSRYYKIQIVLYEWFP